MLTRILTIIIIIIIIIIINKTNDFILNLIPENMSQHSVIEWELHPEEAQHPLKWAKSMIDKSSEM